MSATDSWLVVGLGNPGPKYAGNRHNLGYMVVDALSDQIRSAFTSHRSGALIASGRLGILPGGAPGPKVTLAKTGTYMNVSGTPVAALLKFFSLHPQNLLVVHDELDLPPHSLRLKFGGGEGGHNGLRSISQQLGTKDYARLRVGVGRPPGRMDTADYVLANLPKAELNEWALTVTEAAQVVTAVVTHGFTNAQQELHTA